MAELIKIFAVSVYYLIYLMFQEWVNIPWIFVLGVTAVMGVHLAIKGKRCGTRLSLHSGILVAVLYFGIVILVYQEGGLADGGVITALRTVYYIGAAILALKVSNAIWLFLKEGNRNSESYNVSNEICGKVGIILKSIYTIGLIPILLISPYVFAKADDYSFGYHCHRAWVDTGSVFVVLGNALKMVIEAYEDWQGTFTSIFLMALQPAVFHEKLYCIVPMFFVILMSLSGYFFIKTLLVDVLQAERKKSAVVWWSYIILAVQCVPVKQSAMFWYNGATHYMTAYCMLLFMLGFLMRLYLGKRSRWNWFGAAFTAFYVGGGNLVSGLGTVIIMGTILMVILITKTWKKYKHIWSICFIFFFSFLINVIAPGNFSRKENSEGNALVVAFFLAFKNSLEYMFEHWMHWTIIVFLLICLPVLWCIVKNVKYSFSYPGLVSGYSWCYMSGLFFAPLYTINNVKVGRFQNIMFLQWVILLIINLIYWIGWLQRKYIYVAENGSKLFDKKYLYGLTAFIMIAASICALAEPEHYTSVDAALTLLDENLEQYSEDYWYNVDLLNSDKDPIVLKDLSNIPRFLEPQESEDWHSGLRLFYRKKMIEFEN